MRDPTAPFATATDITLAIAKGAVSAVEVTTAMLARIAATDGPVNAYTDITADRAMAGAQAVDDARRRGVTPGPLAGVPYAVKNLFDVAGLPTRAGSRINRGRNPARQDATLVARMTAAGAVLTGTLNMGEYAYDFTGENAHDGPCLNPHDSARMSGGSSSGCGAATAAGIAPISLGSDTNGSLRVPAALCGVFSLKPTYGAVSRGGTFPFVDSLDHLGPMARTPRDLALAFDAMQGPDPRDHGCAPRSSRPVLPDLDSGTPGLRIGILDGWFRDNADDAALAALMQVADALGADRAARFDAAEAARAAAYVITNTESAAFHLDRLRHQAQAFDPDTRDRFLAGALLPAAWSSRAGRVRHWALQQALDLFRSFDLLIAPATPCAAPLSGERMLTIAGRDLPLRPNLGILAQPFSSIGLPVCTVPVFAPGTLPLGVQIVAAPWREDLALRAAEALHRAGVSVAHPPTVPS